jgi:hypothetical protein
MSKCSTTLLVITFAGLTLTPILRAQTATSNAPGEEAKPDNKWNSVPPIRPWYAGKKSAPAPRRSLSGVWDAAELDGGRQPSGALEHPALLAPRGQGVEGGRPDETGIMRPLHYTSQGLEALKANKPSGPSVRQVPAALANDPVDQCDPIGFPRMELYELRTIELVQTANQVIYLNQFYGNYRVIWTDGRELPKDPEPRWNGYSVGKWVDDYTFVVETVGLNPRSWVDHAGRPHSEDLRVEETFHRVDHDNLELTVKIIDPKMYTEPWLGLNKFPLHLQPADFDLSELICSPIDMQEYNKQVGNAVLAPSEKK